LGAAATVPRSEEVPESTSGVDPVGQVPGSRPPSIRRIVDTVVLVTAWLLLILGLLSLLATISALVRIRRPAQAGFFVMMTSWWTGEYPLFHIGLQAVIAALLIGGTDRAIGQVGLAAYVLSWAGLIVVRIVQTRARPSAEAALAAGLGASYLDELPTERRAALRSRPERGLVLRPLHFDRTGIVVTRNIAYGDAKRNVLDVYQPESSERLLPVVMQVHGGAWVVGHKAQQAQPLLHRLARNGYVGVSINYRLAPKSRFPVQLIDVKRAIAWVKEHIAEYGGDPDLVILTGGSAGGHLVSLAALTPNDPTYQPGFESIDTTIAGCMPFYGPSDFTNRFGIRGRTSSMEIFLKHTVMPGPMRELTDLYHSMSPIEHVRVDAPPFLIIQGSLDVLVWREETRAFAEYLADVSTDPVVYWEVPGAQHAFDFFNSQRSAVAVDTCERFAGWVVARAAARHAEQIKNE
jgi:acetyl esterase/lipase